MPESSECRNLITNELESNLVRRIKGERDGSHKNSHYIVKS